MGNERYIFNKKTLQYEIEQKTTKQKVTYVIRICLGVLLFSVVGYYAGSLLLTTPREKALMQEIQHSNMVIRNMSTEIDEMSLVLQNIQDRDATVHRFMFGMSPIDGDVWQGGIGGHKKYKDYERYDYSGENMKTLNQKVDKLKHKMALQSHSLDTLEKLALERADRLESIPSIKPVRSDKYKRHLHLLSGFGHRIHPIDKVRKMHYGIDFTAPTGTAIHATGKGKVVEVKRSKTGYGNFVKIDHGYGYVTLYAHMHTISVEQGQEVHKGETIGTVGNTGRSTGAHLHYEVRVKGTPVNPIYYCHDGLSPEEYALLVEKASVTNQSFD